MPAPTITALPAAPLRSQTPATFTATAEAFVEALEALPTEINAFGDYIDSLGLDPSDEVHVVTILVTDPNGDAITTGDGKAYYRVPSTLNGMNLIAVAAAVTTVSSSGAPTIQIHNLTQTADMLSTALTIDASETDSSTAAAAAVIDTVNDDVATGDQIRIDIDVAGTGAKGLMVEMQFQAT
jgi:hypothetical protein